MARVQEVKLVEAPPAPKEVIRPKKTRVTREDEMKAKLKDSPFNLVTDAEYTGRGDAEKARRSAYSASYQVNLGRNRAWNDTDPSLVSEDNPQGLVYYAIYRENPKREGVYERLIGLRTHIPEEWKDFVHKAGSRMRKSEVAKQSDATDVTEGPEVALTEQAEESTGEAAAEAAETFEEGEPEDASPSFEDDDPAETSDAPHDTTRDAAAY